MVRRSPLDAAGMRTAFRELDRALDGPVHLIVGGGAAMALAYGHTLATQDVDAFAAREGASVPEIAERARAVAERLHIAPDWLNAHFETFAHVLPRDYPKRLRPVFGGTHLKVDALGPEDLLVMKCFAGRDKDRPHARRLIRQASDLGVVERRLAELIDKRIPGAEAAADVFDDLRDEVGA